MAQQKLFDPIGDRVALERIPVESTPGGIIMPGNVTKGREINKSWVVAVGPDCKQVREGDLVIHDAIMAIEATLGSTTVFVVHEKDIEGIVIGKNRLGKSGKT